MHSSTMSSSSASAETNGRPANIEQYHYPSISTLRRSGRPSNINLSIFEQNNCQSAHDPEIYSAPICYIKQSDNHQRTQMQLIPQPYSASFPYQQVRQPEQHLRVPTQNHHMQLCPPPLPQQQQQQQTLMDPYPQHQHTPHTFPLQGSPNQYRQCFYFPPSTIQGGITSNNHQTVSSHPNHLQNVNMQDPQHQASAQAWSNLVLSSMSGQCINETTASMSIVDDDDDDDEDPSASIDALVADVDSSPHDLLDHQQEKSLNASKTSSTLPAVSISPTPHVYLRGQSHVLTTPPNPLASDDHPDNQLNVVQNLNKTFSPIPSAGFDLPTNNNSNMKLSSSSTSAAGTSIFIFDANLPQSNDLDQEKIPKPLLINSDRRTANTFMQDDSSNQSSTNSSTHQTSTKIFSQMLRSTEQQGLSSSSPRSNDSKRSPLDLGNHLANNSSTTNGHFCAHPDCNKIFANKSALAKHKLTHSQDRKHKCSKCNKGFKRLDHLNGHMLTHDEEKPHKCRVPACNRTYCDGRSLKRHIENVHQDILASLYENRNLGYRIYLPETAVVKMRDASMSTDFSIDSIDSNSPHSSIDNEQPLQIRASTGTKLTATYTYDEEKCVECLICKKPFKNGAALNGHMRLHGGFNERQATSSSVTEKPKRTQGPKRKRVEPVQIKVEQREHPMALPMSDHYSPSSSSTVLPQRFQESILPSREHLTSSSFVSNQSSIHNHHNVSSTKHARMASLNQMTNSPIFSPNEHHQEVFHKSNSPHHPSHRTTNGTSWQHSHIAQPMPANFPLSTIASGSLPEKFLDLLRYSNDTCRQHPPPPQFEKPLRFTSSPMSHRSPNNHQPDQFYTNGSPVPNSTSVINTPATSPYNTLHIDHSPSKLTVQISDTNGIQSSSGPSSTLSYTDRKQRILASLKHQTPTEKPVPIVEEPPSPPPAVLEIIPDLDSPVKKNMSGFLISTPSSNDTSSSSSASSQKHFNYDEVLPEKKRESTQSSFQWPSQFRRQLSLNIPYPISNQVPSTPYTPPPMLSPFRKGPGLYYRVFSHPGQSNDNSSIPTTPIGDESTNPKINIGRDYQAIIPRLQTDQTEYADDSGDELLFSPLDAHSLEKKSLEKFERLYRLNPYLFSPRHSPVAYPLELIYMLLHEYNGDLARTIAALLEGKANDIKQCRPIHQYRFSECDSWTKEEINAFAQATQTCEKNFEVVSKKVGTKTIKQCIEFHYMPKVNLTPQKVNPRATSSVVTRRKRFQMIRAKQQLEDETSSSSFNESRLDDENSTNHSDTSPVTQFSCDIDECSRTFTSDRACRAHRKEHRRIANHPPSAKRSRPMDMNK